MRKYTFMPDKMALPVVILLVFVLAACIPAIQPTEMPVTPPAADAFVTPTTELEAATPGSSTADVRPAVTPRGPDLVASDPEKVSLATGELQLVEFFRFT